MIKLLESMTTRRPHFVDDGAIVIATANGTFGREFLSFS